MKKSILLSFLFFISINSFGQSGESETIVNRNKQNTLFPVTYQLFPTQNTWNFLKLNTRNGKMWQVQYSIEDDSRFETPLNLLPLVDKEKEIDNRFTLYPTQNIWTFILFDQIDGTSWQVQWSIDSEDRGIWPIE